MILLFIFTLAKFPLTDQSVKSVRFTSDGQSVIWLQRKAGGPHGAALSLVKTALPITEDVNN